MRRHFTLITLLLAFSLYSQSRLKEVELAFSYRLDNQPTAIRAYLAFHEFIGDSLQLTFLQSVDSVKLEQGRIKAAQAFRQKEDQLYIKIPAALDARSRLVIYYRFPWVKMQQSPYLQAAGKGWAINALNLLDEQANLGQTGFFYPAQPKQHHLLKLSISLPGKQQFKAPGEIDYVVEHDGGRSYFSSTAKPVLASAFYLILGEFDDAEEFVEDQELAQSSREELRALKIEQELGPALRYFSKKTGFLYLQEHLLQIENPSTFDTSGFFLTAPELPPGTGKYVWLKTAALLATNANKTAANQLLYQYLHSAGGNNWEQQILQNRYQNYQRQGPFFWEKYLNRLLRQESMSLQDTARLGKAPASSPGEALLSVARQVYRQQSPLKLRLKYRYLGPQKELQLLLSQVDSNLNLSLALQTEIITGADSLREIEIMGQLGLNDTLSIALGESPQSVMISLREGLPVLLQQERPQSYWLYDLSRHPSAARQQAALLELLQTKNPALLATVVGIALSSGDVSLQTRGLQAASQLNAAGKRRIEHGLRKLAQTAEVELVKNKAQIMVKEFYE